MGKGKLIIVSSIDYETAELAAESILEEVEVGDGDAVIVRPVLDNYLIEFLGRSKASRNNSSADISAILLNLHRVDNIIFNIITSGKTVVTTNSGYARLAAIGLGDEDLDAAIILTAGLQVAGTEVFLDIVPSKEHGQNDMFVHSATARLKSLISELSKPEASTTNIDGTTLYRAGNLQELAKEVAGSI